MSNNAKYSLLLILQSLFWGVGNPVMKIAMFTMPPLWCLFFRFALACRHDVDSLKGLYKNKLGVLLMLVREVAPHIFAKAGPACLRGQCPEGAKSCGKMAEMRAK